MYSHSFQDTEPETSQVGQRLHETGRGEVDDSTLPSGSGVKG